MAVLVVISERQIILWGGITYQLVLDLCVNRPADSGYTLEIQRIFSPSKFNLLLEYSLRKPADTFPGGARGAKNQFLYFLWWTLYFCHWGNISKKLKCVHWERVRMVAECPGVNLWNLEISNRAALKLSLSSA